MYTLFLTLSTSAWATNSYVIAFSILFMLTTILSYRLWLLMEKNRLIRIRQRNWYEKRCEQLAMRYHLNIDEQNCLHGKPSLQIKRRKREDYQRS